MRTIFAPPPPLPEILEHPGSPGPARRHRIGDYVLQPGDVDQFNLFLSRLGHPQPPLDRDSLVTAARQLSASSGRSAPACIRQRLRRGTAICWMTDDPSWDLRGEAAAVAGAVTAYLRDRNDLFPDKLPQVGLLDDAIVVESVWDRLVSELASYLDFRRLRRVEATLRGFSTFSTFSFRREDWEQARRAEAGLAAHRRTVRESSYLYPDPALFRIH